MKVEIFYTTNSGFVHTRIIHDCMLDIIKFWTESCGHRARILICSEKRIKYGRGANVAVFCVYTYNAKAVYRASVEMRKQGTIVILGGPHFNSDLTIEEGTRFGDVVVQSVCEEQWRRTLSDIESGTIRPNMQRGFVVRDTEGKFEFPEDFFKTYRNRRRFEFPLIFTTIGCPFRCEFCSSSVAGRYAMRDIGNVVSEIKNIRNTTIVIADASFGLNARFTASLLKAMAPLGKRYWAEMTLGRLDDEELLDLLVHAGIGWIAVGIEGFASSMKKHGPGEVVQNRERLRAIIRKMTDRNIVVQANFICGLDGDTEESFKDILDIYLNSSIGSIYIDLLVPFPNSGIYSRFMKEGRIFDTDWQHYNFEHVVFRPLGMTPRRLMEKYIELYAGLMSPRVFLRKTIQLLRNNGLDRGFFFMTLWNLAKTIEAPMRLRRLRRNLDDLIILERGDADGSEPGDEGRVRVL